MEVHMSLVERELVEVERVSETERRARLLEAAALEIEVRGWTQLSAGMFGEGGLCLLGGIKFATGEGYPGCGDDGNWEKYATHWGGNARPADLWDWNDADERTADEVTFVLRWRAAELRDGFDKPAPEGR